MKKLMTLSIIFVIVLSSFVASSPRVKAISSPATIRVPQDYPTIQEAINAADPGDTIFVGAGTYYENVVVDKAVSLVGESREATIVDGSSVGTVIEVNADNVTITNLTIRNSGGWGFPGIGLYFVENSVISENNIVNNVYRDNSVGIWIYCSSNNNIVQNNIEAVHHGIYVYGIEMEGYNLSSDNNFTRNNISGMAIGQGIELSGGDRNSIFENYITNFTSGIEISSVQFGPSRENTFVGNRITDNVYYGIYINNASSSFYHNSFVDNPYQVFIHQAYNVINVWDDDYPSGGNYWSDYIGVDNHSGPNQNQPGSDGIGDTPYVINENNIDHYPLMTPYTPARIFVTLINLDDDVQNVDIYVDGVFWKQVSDIEHFETRVTEGKEVDGNQEHTVLVSWYEVDSETQFSKSSTVYIAIDQEVTVAFQIDPIFKIKKLTLQGEIEETREAIFWGVTQDDHFEVYYDKSLHIQASYVLTIAQAAQHSWNELVPFLTQPHDQDGDGRIEIFVSDISISIFGKNLVNGYVDYNDLNELGFIYIDDKISGGSDFVSAVVSHEFTHRIEFAYIDQEPDAQRDGWMLEGIAQFCADYAWDSSGIFQKDYVDPFAKNPDISLVSKLSGYSAGYVYFEFLSEKFGTSIIGEILTKWETGISAVEAVEQATGKTFSELFDEFAKRNYVNDYDGTAKTFEDTDIFAQPFEKHSVNFLKRSVSGSGTVNEWAADYVKFTTSRSTLNISFSGEEGRAYSVIVEKIVGSYTSYSVVYIILTDNKGWVIIENAKEFSQIVLVVIRHDDAYDLGSYTYQAKAG